MSKFSENHWDKITWDNTPESSDEKPWETLPVGEISLPQLARCLQECEDWQKKDEVLFRALWEKNNSWVSIWERIDFLEKANWNTFLEEKKINIVIRSLKEIATWWIDKTWDVIDGSPEDKRIERAYTEVEYFSSRLRFTKYSKHFTDLIVAYQGVQKSFLSWDISKQEMEKQIYKYGALWNALLVKITQEAEMNQLAEFQPWSWIEESNIYFSETEQKVLLDNSIKIVPWAGEKIHIFIDNVYLKSFDLEEGIKWKIMSLARGYSPFRIDSIVLLRIDTEDSIDKAFVRNSSQAQEITIPKKFMTTFETATQAGIEIQVEQFNSKRDFTLWLYKWKRKLWELEFNDENFIYSCYTLPEFINSIILMSEVEPNTQKWKAFQYLWLEKQSYPDNLDIEERIVEIMNLLHTQKWYLTIPGILLVLTTLPQNLEIPLSSIPSIIQRYYFYKIENAWQASHIVANAQNIIPWDFETIPWMFNFSDATFSTYLDLKWVMNSVLFKAIQYAPREACVNIDGIMDKYLRMYIQQPEGWIGRYGSKTNIRYNILSSIFDNKPSLRNDFPELFSEFSDFESKIMERDSYDAIFSWGMDPNLSRFTNAIQLPATFDILRYIPDTIFDEGQEYNEKQKEELKLAIARNISFRFNMDPFKIKREMISRWNSLIEEEWENILKLRRDFSWETIFEDKDTYHIIHWWQWFDAYGTDKTIEWFKNKKWNGSYTSLDGEDMQEKSLGEREEMLARIWKNFIMSPNDVTIVLEWHANNGLFSLYLWSKTQDSTASFFSDQETIDITPEDLAHVLHLRNNWKQKNKKSDSNNDIIIFSACRWDYIVNMYNEILKKNNWDFSNNFIPPIIISAAEFWQDSVYNPGADIPQQFFREVLMLKDPSVNPTIQTLFDNQDSKENLSNPTIFVPIFQDWKWIPKNLG